MFKRVIDQSLLTRQHLRNRTDAISSGNRLLHSVTVGTGLDGAPPATGDGAYLSRSFSVGFRYSYASATSGGKKTIPGGQDAFDSSQKALRAKIFASSLN